MPTLHLNFYPLLSHHNLLHTPYATCRWTSPGLGSPTSPSLWRWPCCEGVPGQEEGGGEGRELRLP